MNLKNNHKGFSLIEMIVVVGIIGIIGGISITLLSHVRHANNEKVVQSIVMSLSKQQAQTMSKQTKPFLYIYELSGEYFVCLSTTEISSFDNSVLTKNAGTSLGSGYSIYNVNAAGTAESLVTGSNFIKIAYKRDGSFDSSRTNCGTVSIRTSSLITDIKLVQISGKHVISTR